MTRFQRLVSTRSGRVLGLLWVGLTMAVLFTQGLNQARAQTPPAPTPPVESTPAQAPTGSELTEAPKEMPVEPAQTADVEGAVPTPDPTGAETAKTGAYNNSGLTTFTADEVQQLRDGGDTPATKAELAKTLDAIGQSATALNFVWVLFSGFLVMFMQAGFAMVETGFCRAKHAAHVIMTNFMVYPIGMLGFWICGFAIMFGSVAATKIGGPFALASLPILDGKPLELFPGFSIAGTKGFFLNPSVYDVSIYAFFLFQMVFMDTTVTIPTGAMAERWRFSAFIIYGFFVSMLVYPVYGHMVWGGGGLAMLGQNFNLGHGAVDFAGSSVVHAVGGFLALAGTLALGPRLGKYNKDGSANALPGHHIPMAIIGTFILAFGWFGFNAGSMLGAAGGNLRIGVVATNTMLASAGGAMAACLLMKIKFGKYDPSMCANGFLAGLVAITAPCAFVNASSSVLIGALAGVLVVASIFFWEKRRVDDPVGAISVHGVCGIFGMLCVGLFADGSYGAGWNGVGASEYLGVAGKGVTGLFYGDGTQLLAQVIACTVCVVWAFGLGALFFGIQKKFMPIRPTAEEELEGLDVPEMGVEAYPAFQQLEPRGLHRS